MLCEGLFARSFAGAAWCRRPSSTSLSTGHSASLNVSCLTGMPVETLFGRYSWNCDELPQFFALGTTRTRGEDTLPSTMEGTSERHWSPSPGNSCVVCLPVGCGDLVRRAEVQCHSKLRCEAQLAASHTRQSGFWTVSCSSRGTTASCTRLLSNAPFSHFSHIPHYANSFFFFFFTLYSSRMCVCFLSYRMCETVGTKNFSGYAGVISVVVWWCAKDTSDIKVDVMGRNC